MIGLAARATMLAAVAAGVVVLFGPPALLRSWTGADLGFLAVPLAAFVCLQVAGVLARRFLPERSRFLAWVVETGGWLWLVFFIIAGLQAIAMAASRDGPVPSPLQSMIDFMGPSTARSIALLVTLFLGVLAIRRWRRKASATVPIGVWIAMDVLPALLWAAFLYVLLGKNGLLASIYRLDLTQLAAPIVVALVLSVAGRLAALLWPGRTGDAARAVFLSLSNVLIVGWVLYYLPSLVDSIAASKLSPPGIDAATRSFHRIWHWSYAVGGIALAVGAGLRRVLGVWGEEAPRWISYTAPALHAGLMLVVGTVLRTLFRSLSTTWEPAQGLSQVVLWGTIAMVVSALLVYLRGARHPLVSGFSQWASGSQSKAFIIGGLAGTYFAFIRPPLFDSFRYAYAVEWFVIAAVAWRLMAIIREESGRVYTRQTWEMGYTSWRKHRQEVETRTDAQLSDIQRALQWFVEEGIKDEMVVLMVNSLSSKGLDRPSVARLIHGLMAYQERPVPFLAFPFQRRRAIKHNLEARYRLLKETVGALDLDEAALERLLTTKEWQNGP